MAFGDMMGMMKQAKQLQERMEALQQEIALTEIEGSAGGGLVTVVMTGHSEMNKIHIATSLL
jgi:DNA-binding YbaB/EbfC family protein